MALGTLKLSTIRFDGLNPYTILANNSQNLEIVTGMEDGDPASIEKPKFNLLDIGVTRTETPTKVTYSNPVVNVFSDKLQGKMTVNGELVFKSVQTETRSVPSSEIVSWPELTSALQSMVNKYK